MYKQQLLVKFPNQFLVSRLPNVWRFDFTPTASRAIYSARACGDGGALSDDSDADNEFNSVLMKPGVTRAGGLRPRKGASVHRIVLAGCYSSLCLRGSESLLLIVKLY